MPDQSPDVMSVEFFAANDPQDGSVSGIMMAVPCRCGLIEADTLRVDGLVMLAMKGPSVLNIDLPDLTPASLANLQAWAQSGAQLAVAEFSATGLSNSYFLELKIVGSR